MSCPRSHGYLEALLFRKAHMKPRGGKGTCQKYRHPALFQDMEGWSWQRVLHKSQPTGWKHRVETPGLKSPRYEDVTCGTGLVSFLLHPPWLRDSQRSQETKEHGWPTALLTSFQLLSCFSKSECFRTQGSAAFCSWARVKREISGGHRW